MQETTRKVTNRSSVLETEHLSRTVLEKTLVSDISVRVLAAEILAVVGPSGAGKSSFLRLLNRLDEPTVGIDPVLRAEFWEKFRSLRDRGATLLLTTHVMDEADRCDRLALIFEGRVLAFGTPAEVRRGVGASTTEDAFLALRARSESGKEVDRA